MSAFADLHRPGQPFLLPNAWDVASALMIQAAGFPAVATTSLGITAAAGLLDGAGAGLNETMQLVQLLHGRLGVPLSVDFEGGFSDDPAQVASHCARLVELGVAGVNLEDGLRHPGRHADVIAAVVECCPGLFVNARTDVHWLRIGPSQSRHEEVLTRARLYAAAGADGIFAPGLSDPSQVLELTQAIDLPLNLLWSDDLAIGELRTAGVARFSTGSGPYRTALAAAREHVLRAVGRPPAGPVSYADIQQLLEGQADGR